MNAPLVLAPIGAASVALAVAVMLASRRRVVDVSIELSVDERARWTVGGGAQLGTIAAIALAARGDGLEATTAWTLRAFGRTLASHATHAQHDPASRAHAWRQRLLRIIRLDAGAVTELATSVVLRRLRVESLAARVRAAFVDPVVSGHIATWVAVARATLAPVAAIDAELDWCAESDSLAASLALRVSFVPFALLVDFAHIIARRAARRAHGSFVPSRARRAELRRA